MAEPVEDLDRALARINAPRRGEGARFRGRGSADAPVRSERTGASVEGASELGARRCGRGDVVLHMESGLVLVPYNTESGRGGGQGALSAAMSAAGRVSAAAGRR